jgi:RNA polymerase primary sigma factor
MAKMRMDKNKEMLAQYAHTKSPEILKQLVLANQLLAWKVAQKHVRFSPSSLNLSDLFHEAITGLIEAIKRFEIEKGFALSTYAMFWMERNVRRAKEEKGEMIRYPENFTRLLSMVKRVQSEFNQDSSSTPNELRQFVLDRTGLSEQEYEEILLTDFVCGQVASLQDVRHGEEEQREIGEDLAYSNGNIGTTFHKEYQDAAELCCDTDRKQILRQALLEMNDCDRQVIEMYFGLGDTESCSVVELSRKLNMPKSRVTKIVQSGLVQLRSILKRWNISFEDVA